VDVTSPSGDLAIDTISGLVGDCTILYLATPFNGGPRFIRLLEDRAARVDYECDLEREVIGPNRSDAQREAKRLRAATGRPVFDPTCFGRYVGWDQQSYVDLCLAIIRQKADGIIFAAGWEYSAGCVAEYDLSVSLALPRLTHDLEALPDHKAAQAIQIADEHAASLGWDLRRGCHVRSVA
jgi:hypothetical protein